jgi:L-threonylcarbamoyladenylate synthase
MMIDTIQAARALKDGKVVAYPTEAVYGLGCDPMNEAALEYLAMMKQRPENMGLIVVGSSWQQLVSYMSALSELHHAALVSSWPDALTWIVPVAQGVPAALTGGRDTIALRWTKHPDVCALCDAFGGAIVSTSANVHGQSPCLSAMCVTETFVGFSEFAGVLNGELGGHARPTPIRDLTTGDWVRT